MLDLALDVLLLRKAVARARSYSPAQAERVHSFSQAADARVRAAKSLSAKPLDPVRAELFREALAFRVNAAAVDVHALVRSALDENEMMRVDAALSATDPLHFDAMDEAALAEVTGALVKAERAARRGVEPRTLERLRVERAGRIGALLVVVAYVAFRFVVSWIAPPNVAYHKSVSVMTNVPLTVPASTLVDGDTNVTYSPPVARGANAAFTVDLGGVYTIDHVRIYNRKDEAFDYCLPLDLETSNDDEHWTLFERRRDHFIVWEEKMNGTRARYVRVRTESSTLGLVEIEIYGRFYGR